MSSGNSQQISCRKLQGQTRYCGCVQKIQWCQYAPAVEVVINNDAMITTVKDCSAILVSEAEKYDPPLSYLFEEDLSTSDSAALIYRLCTNEKIELTYKCLSVTPFSETPGDLLIGEKSFQLSSRKIKLNKNRIKSTAVSVCVCSFLMCLFQVSQICTLSEMKQSKMPITLKCCWVTRTCCL